MAQVFFFFWFQCHKFVYSCQESGGRKLIGFNDFIHNMLLHWGFSHTLTPLFPHTHKHYVINL